MVSDYNQRPVITTPTTSGQPSMAAQGYYTTNQPSMNPEAYPTSTTVRKQSPPGASGWEWVILIIVLLLVIGVIVWMIWFFGFRSIGKPPGASCSLNSDCEEGTYCSASGVCETGEGAREGDRCNIDPDCLNGLMCDPDTNMCMRNTSPIMNGM